MRRRPPFRRPGLLIALFVLAGSLGGCLERSGGVGTPRWDADGRHVFYLEQRLVSSVDTSESYHLYRARPDLRDRVKLAAGKIRSQRPSPDGAWLLYQERDVLVLHDVRNRKEVRRIPDTRDLYLKPAAWLPDASTFSFRDSQGIHLESVDGSIRRLLVPGEMYQLGWSRSGRLLAYTSGRGWPQGNDLYVLDIRTNQRHVVASRRSGRFSGALFTADETRILFVVEFVDGRSESQLHMANLAGSAEAEIWRGPGSLLEEDGLRWTKFSDRLLVATNELPAPRVTLQAIDLGGRARQLVEQRTFKHFSWDYHSDADALIVPTRDHAGFMVIVVGEALGSHSDQPELGAFGLVRELGPSRRRQGRPTARSSGPSARVARTSAAERSVIRTDWGLRPLPKKRRIRP